MSSARRASYAQSCPDPSTLAYELTDEAIMDMLWNSSVIQLRKTWAVDIEKSGKLLSNFPVLDNHVSASKLQMQNQKKEPHTVR